MITKGISYIILATLAFSIMNVMAKDLSDFHPMQVVFFRSFGTFVFIFPYMLYHKVSILGNNVKFLALRGLVGVASLSLFFIAIQRIPLGSAISIRYIGPIFGAVLAAYFLKEKINLKQWISFAIAFGGVLLIKGFDLRIDYLSFILILISAFLLGGVFVLIRYLSTREHFLTIINYFMVTSVCLSLFFVHTWRMPLSHEWYSVIGIGIMGLIGQVFMTKAFQTEETSVLAPFKYMELVFALILGYFIFGETYQWIPFVGIGLIILGMIMNVRAKNQLKVKAPTA